MNQMIAEADFVNATADKHAQGNPMLPLAASGLRFAINGRALVDVEALDLALTRFEEEHPRPARLVMLRYFGGLSNDELAAALGVSARTVKRRWRFARAWLQARMQEPAEERA